MINFTRAFDSAWERMTIILFRPFDIGKWFIIGFSAFLAGFLQGGNGSNGGSFNNNFSDFGKSTNTTTTYTTNSFNFHQFPSTFSHLVSTISVGLIILVAVMVFLLILALLFVFYWLGARGQFLLLDNIVRNRGALAWPWHQYSRAANSLFGIYLLFMAISFAIILPMVGVAVLIGLPLFRQHRWPHGAEIAGFVFLGLLYLAFVVVGTFIIFVFREFGVPLMFRNGLMARPAFWETMKLLKQNPGNIAIFVLLRFALSIAVWVLSTITCCMCCIGIIPYIGTIVILPALIYVRCFTLDCLAQFGPEFDAWTVDVPPSAAAALPTPPPPLG